jgi:hypothetical protein
MRNWPVRAPIQIRPTKLIKLPFVTLCRFESTSTDKTTNAYRHVGFVVWTHNRKLYGDPDAPPNVRFRG